MQRERRTAKGRWNQGGHRWEEKNERRPQAQGPGEAGIVRAEPRLPDLGLFSDLKGEGPLSAGKQACGQETDLGSRAGRSWDKAGRLRGRKNRKKAND